jgi:hypothetical protein
MDYRETFRAALGAALAEYEDYTGKEDPTEAFMFAVTEAASDWASSYGNERYNDGMADEREVHFG